MPEEKIGFDKEWDMKLYIEKLLEAKRIAETVMKEGLKLTTDNITSIATSMFIQTQQRIARSKQY